MLNYQLAKQLKDAGFPQGLTENQYGWIEAHQGFELNNGDMRIGFSAPTLSELIEACGARFQELYRCDDGTFEAIEAGDGFEDSGRFTKGSTPEEAIAKLWMELNKNSSKAQ